MDKTGKSFRHYGLSLIHIFIALFILRNKFFTIFKDYQARYLGKGKVDPNFYVFYEDNPEISAKEEAIRAELRKEVADAYAAKGR